MNTIKVIMKDGRIFAKSAKSESELEFYPASIALCAKGHTQLANARLLIPKNPIWWLEESAQNGEWVDLEFTCAVAGNMPTALPA